MTKHEHAINDRPYLRFSTYSITKSLKRKLAAAKNLTEREKEWCCFIQNGVLWMLRRFDTEEASIGREYFKNKIREDYLKYIKLLQKWGELSRSEYWVPPVGDSPGQTKTHSIPKKALDSGTTCIKFKTKATPTKDKSELPSSEPWIAFIHSNLKQLSSAKDLKEIETDSTANSFNHHQAKKIFHRDFGVHRPKDGNCRRLFHSIIDMPKESRCNLVWRDTDQPVQFEFDVKSCHPVLLLTLINNAEERKQYVRDLDHDIYDVIREEGDVGYTRDGCKTEFMRFLNFKEKSHKWGRGNYVYRYFHEHFPILTEAILKRPNLAVELQNLEASIMVDELGKFCMEKGIFYIPMHDGFFCKPADFDQVAAFVTNCFYKITGYTVTITAKYLNILPSPPHIWGYNPPVHSDPVWEKKLAEYKTRHPEAELEKATAELDDLRKLRKAAMKRIEESKADGKRGAALLEARKVERKRMASLWKKHMTP